MQFVDISPLYSKIVWKSCGSLRKYTIFWDIMRYYVIHIIPPTHCRNPTYIHMDRTTSGDKADNTLEAHQQLYTREPNTIRILEHAITENLRGTKKKMDQPFEKKMWTSPTPTPFPQMALHSRVRIGLQVMFLRPLGFSLQVLGWKKLYRAKKKPAKTYRNRSNHICSLNGFKIWGKKWCFMLHAEQQSSSINSECENSRIRGRLCCNSSQLNISKH